MRGEYNHHAYKQRKHKLYFTNKRQRIPARFKQQLGND